MFCYPNPNPNLNPNPGMFIYVFKCFVHVYMFVEYLWKTEMVNTVVQQALKFFVDRLGYESLKPKQETVVWEFLSSKIVFVALPTGYGKSLCYACLPYAFDNMRGKEGSIVIRVSPLVGQKAKFVPR